MPTQLTFDGFGINDTDEYRTRLVTFAQSVPDDRRKELARLWIAAPELLEALKEMVELREELARQHPSLFVGKAVLNRAKKAITKAEGKGTPS